MCTFAEPSSYLDKSVSRRNQAEVEYVTMKIA